MGGRGGGLTRRLKKIQKREDKLSDDERKIPFIPSFNSLAVRNYPFLRQISLSFFISLSYFFLRFPSHSLLLECPSLFPHLKIVNTDFLVTFEARLTSVEVGNMYSPPHFLSSSSPSSNHLASRPQRVWPLHFKPTNTSNLCSVYFISCLFHE